MGIFRNYVADEWLFPAAVAFLLVGAAFAFVVGAGLVLRSGAMFRFFAAMNRWVSTREMMKSAERARDLDAILHRRRGALGATILAAAGLSLWMLLRHFDVEALAVALRHQAPAELVEVAARSLKWFLVAGHVAALAAGVALLVAPAAFARLEARANRWHSLRERGRGLELMHLTLDQWVAAYPRAIGFVILALALFVIVSLGGAVLGRGPIP